MIASIAILSVGVNIPVESCFKQATNYGEGRIYASKPIRSITWMRLGPTAGSMTHTKDDTLRDHLNSFIRSYVGAYEGKSVLRLNPFDPSDTYHCFGYGDHDTLSSDCVTDFGKRYSKSVHSAKEMD